MYNINNINGDIHFPDGFILSVPYDSARYHEYADWVIAGNNPTEISIDNPVSVPEKVSKFQAKVALYNAGHLATIEAIMTNPATPELTKLAWAEAQDFNRQSVTVLSLGAILGLTSTDLDNLFIAASQIVA
jgi:hypothetical protein